MNEELAMQHSVQNQYQPAPKKRGVWKWVGLVLLALVLIGGIGYGVAYAWRQYTDVKASLASEQVKNQDLLTKNTLLQKDATDASATPMASDTLPDGKTATYPLTADNAQIVFWMQDGQVAISDKRVMNYVSGIETTLRKKVCSISDSSFDQMDVGMGTVDTTKKEYSKNQADNCLQLMASTTTNTDATTRAAAQEVLDKVDANITQFIQAATIQ